MVSPYVRIELDGKGQCGTVVAAHPDYPRRVEATFECTAECGAEMAIAEVLEAAIRATGVPSIPSLLSTVREALIDACERRSREQEAVAAERQERRRANARQRSSRRSKRRPGRTTPAVLSHAIEALSGEESQTLAGHERTIERGLGGVLEVGSSLAAIRTGRLYRASFATFEEYCRQRWSMSGRTANRLVMAATVAKLLGPIGPAPRTESVLRPLGTLRRPDDTLDEAAVKAAWQEACNAAGAGTPTARLVEQAVRKHLGAREPAPATKGDWRQRTARSLERLVAGVPASDREELRGMLDVVLRKADIAP